MLVIGWEAGCHGHCCHADSHTGAADHEKCTSTQTINCEEGNEAAEEFPSKSTRGKDLGKTGAHVQVRLKDSRCVDRDKIASTHLLEELKENTQAESIEQALIIVL